MKKHPEVVWNHRVVRKVYPKAAPSERVFVGIHEVYYEKKGKRLGKPFQVTVEPIAPYGKTRKELRETFEMMRDALDKPILNYSKIGKK